MALFTGNLMLLDELLPLFPTTEIDNWTVDMFTADERQLVYSSSNFHLHCPRISLVHLYFHYHKVFASQDPRQLTKSSIEYIWDLMRKISRGMTRDEYGSIVLGRIGGMLDSDAAILLFQLVSALENCPKDYLFCILNVLDHRMEGEGPLLLRWMRNDQLHTLRKFAQDTLSLRTGDLPSFHRRQATLVLDKVKEEEQSRTLQDLCRIAILHSVRGVSADVMALPLPGPLKASFKIPFQEEYEQLCSASQHNQDQQLQQN